MNQVEVTRSLAEWRDGDEAALDRLMAAVYDHLKLIAHRHKVHQKDGQTLNTTGLVHEAYIKMLGQRNRDYANRGHFYAIISTCMKRVILETARSRSAQKRGGNQQRVELEPHFVVSEEDAAEILTMNDAIEKLRRFDPDLARVVDLKYFIGLKAKEMAEVLDCSESKVNRDWKLARVWLATELGNR